MYLKNWKGIYE